MNDSKNVEWRVRERKTYTGGGDRQTEKENNKVIDKEDEKKNGETSKAEGHPLVGISHPLRLLRESMRNW